MRQVRAKCATAASTVSTSTCLPISMNAWATAFLKDRLEVVGRVVPLLAERFIARVGLS